MKFDIKKFLICFCFVFVFNCVHINTVYANPAVVAPIVTEGLGELLLIIAGICGIQFQTQNDANAFNERFINQCKDNSGDLLIEQNDLGFWQLTPDGEKQLKKENEHIKQISGDYLKSWCSDFKTVVDGLVDCGDLKIAYDYSGDTSLYDVMKKYDLPSLDNFSGQPGASDCKITSSISEFINTDNFCYLLQNHNSFSLKITSYKGSNVPIINSTNGNGKLCYAGNGYMFSYSIGSGGDVWKSGGWAQKDSFYIYDGDDILNGALIWTNKNILDLSGNKVKNSDVVGVVDGANVGDYPLQLPADDNVFNLDWDGLNDLIDGKAKDNIWGNVSVPDISIGSTGDITYDPTFNNPINDRIIADPIPDYPLDVPTVDPDVVDVPVVDNPSLFDWFSNFWSKLWDLLQKLGDFIVNKIIKALGELLLSLFTVEDTYFTDKLNYYKDKLTSIFNLDFDFFNTFNNLSDDDFKNISVVLFGKKIDIVNFASLNEYRKHFRMIIAGIVEIFFWFFNYRQLVWLIRNGTAFSGSSGSNGKGGNKNDS